MKVRIIGEAAGIAVEHGAHVGGELFIVPIHLLPHADELDIPIVGDGELAEGQEAEPPARRGEDPLNRREVVLGVRVGEAERRVLIALAEDVRHAELVADDVDAPDVLERRRVRRWNRGPEGIATKEHVGAADQGEDRDDPDRAAPREPRREAARATWRRRAVPFLR